MGWIWPRKPSSPPPPSPARARKFYSGDPLYRALNGFPKITIFLLSFPFSRKGEGRKQQPGTKPASACRQSKENMRMLSSGCPGKAGASIYTCLHPQHLPRPSVLGDGFVDGVTKQIVRFEAVSPAAPRGPGSPALLISCASPTSPLLPGSLRREPSADSDARLGGWVWKAPRHQTCGDSSHQTLPRFNCPKISRVGTAVIASEPLSLANCQLSTDRPAFSSRETIFWKRASRAFQRMFPF